MREPTSSSIEKFLDQEFEDSSEKEEKKEKKGKKMPQQLKEKLLSENGAKEDARSFLNFSRENLNISQTELERGFNKQRFRPNKHTILSGAALLIALLCFALETWKLRCSLLNAHEIEELKRDVKSLKHRFLQQDLLDELKAFEEQLYATESTDEDDPGEMDIDNADYDSNYDDDSSSAHDYSTDYHALSVHSTSEGPKSVSSSTSTNIKASNASPLSSLASNETMMGIIAALHKAEARKGQTFERNVQEEYKNAQLEGAKGRSKFKENSTKQHEEEEEEEEEGGREGEEGNFTRQRRHDVQRGKESTSELGYVNLVESRAFRRRRRSSIDLKEGEKSPPRNGEDKTSRTTPRHLRNQGKRNFLSTRFLANNRNTSASLAFWERHPPKKYHAYGRENASRATAATLPSDRRAEEEENTSSLNEEIAHATRRASVEVGDGVQRFDWKDEIHENANTETISRQLRRVMNRRHLRAPRQVYAVHYGADSTLFSEEDEHAGNGKARHSEGVFKAWRASDWVEDLGMNRHFTLANDGKLTVHESGLYLTYAQIHYLDEHDENGFHLLVNGRPILQCMVFSPGIGHKSRSCFSAQVTVLQANDVLVLKDVGSARYTLFQHDKSFFGLVKLGESKVARHQAASQSPP